MWVRYGADMTSSTKSFYAGHRFPAELISNQCGRLIANIIIAYNSILLSTLLERYQGGDNRRALALLRKISPVAWQHIHLLGHYTFRGNGHAIDLEALLANVRLG